VAVADSLGGIAWSIRPAQVRATLAAIELNWPKEAPSLADVVNSFPLGKEALLHLLSISSICGARLIQQPAILLWLSDPETCADRRGYGRMLTDLRNLVGRDSVAEKNFRLLRWWKGREMVRIALREVAAVAPLEETMIELSQLADICLTTVYDHWNEELRQRSGSPASQFAIIGLGKLGGRELNHSSDVDLVFVYSEEGELSPRLSYHQWFTRLGNKITETFSASDPAGSLFRVDLRLRPEGRAGPLVRSLESMENYYAGFGEMWERLALVKARWICGDRELAYDFLRQLQPFVFPKSPTRDLLDEVAALKERIERDIVGFEERERNVKLGIGGIREIEFVVQALQLLHAARYPFLQEAGTLKAIRGLAELEFLPNDDAEKLESAYCFLRRVEHRLQIEAEQQTHTVPEGGEALEILAASLGFRSRTELLSSLRTQMQAVRAIFTRVVGETGPAGDLLEGAFVNFRDPIQAARMFGQLGQSATGFHVAPRTRQIFRKLQPLLLDWLQRSPDPDSTLTQFVRFVEAYGFRSLLFELLAANPRLLELLIKAFNASEAAGGWLIRRPQWLEELTRSGMLDRTFSLAQHRERLYSLGASAENIDRVRVYRQRELLRILLRDVLRLAPLPQLLAEQNDLAEACLTHVDQLLNPERRVTIIAMGKFGGREIGYGADLDILFVGQSHDQKPAQNLIASFAQTSGEGRLGALDARLRPDGEKGPLVASLESFLSYYSARAQFWELQSLTRARSISGPLGFEFLALAHDLWGKAGERSDLVRQIENMLVRIANERGSGNDFFDFKTGIGGMIEAEFLIQALQMQHRVWEPNSLRAIEQLAGHGAIESGDAARLRKAYDFLRGCESTLRRIHFTSVSTLPTTHEEDDRFARRMNFRTIEEFRGPYSRARETIHSLRLRYLTD
jgi:[glutamine synthetase] adenylyltransferase / [glutamine synthetase]-adenylyl-L-tyrosine phosphorylase